MDWYVQVLTKYAEFNGRATRSEYWYFTLINFVAIFALSFIDGFVGIFSINGNVGLFAGLYSLLVLVPYLAVTVRRLHDTNRSGWWLLLEFVPVLGSLVLFIWMVLDSQAGENQYGKNPKPLY